MQPETALVGTEGRVELHTISAVDLEVALVVLPDDAELDHALGDGNDLEGDLVFGVLLEERAVLERARELCAMLCEPSALYVYFLRRGLTGVGLLELGLGRQVGHGDGREVNGGITVAITESLMGYLY